MKTFKGCNVNLLPLQLWVHPLGHPNYFSRRKTSEQEPHGGYCKEKKTVIILLSCVYISNGPWPSSALEILLGTLGHDHGGPMVCVLTMSMGVKGCAVVPGDIQIDMTIDRRKGCGNSDESMRRCNLTNLGHPLELDLAPHLCEHRNKSHLEPSRVGRAS